MTDLSVRKPQAPSPIRAHRPSSRDSRFRRVPGFTIVAMLDVGAGDWRHDFHLQRRRRHPPSPAPLSRTIPPGEGRPHQRGRRGRRVLGRRLSRREARDSSFAGVAGYREDISDVTGSGDPVRVPGIQTTAAFFDVLQATPIIGRVYSAADEGRGAFAVISEGLWQRQFGSRADIVGTRVRVNGTPTEILGVVRHSVRHPLKADLWTLAPGPVPTSPVPSEKGLAERNVQYFGVMARLAPGATFEDTNRQIAALGERLAREFPDSNKGESFHVRPLAESLVVDVRTGLLVLLGAVACVLLIACANVARLMLARSLSRRRELAVRASLGASTWRLARQLIVESLLLACVGGAAGLMLAGWGVDVLLAVAPEQLTRLSEVTLDWRVAAIASLAIDDRRTACRPRAGAAVSAAGVEPGSSGRAAVPGPRSGPGSAAGSSSARLPPRSCC